MDIIFFAFIAFYLFYKLYTILGQDSRDRHFKFNLRNVKDITQTASEDMISKIKSLNNHRFSNIFNIINSQDNNFAEEKFIKGAKSAFEFIIKAFCDKDKDLLYPLLSKNVYDQFVKKIEEASKKNYNINKLLVSIKEVEVIDAVIEKKIAIITVKFITEQINFVKDDNDNLIEGDLAKIDVMEDIWKFSKDITISDPNWILLEIL